MRQRDKHGPEVLGHREPGPSKDLKLGIREMSTPAHPGMFFCFPYFKPSLKKLQTYTASKSHVGSSTHPPRFHGFQVIADLVRPPASAPCPSTRAAWSSGWDGACHSADRKKAPAQTLTGVGRPSSRLCSSNWEIPGSTCSWQELQGQPRKRMAGSSMLPREASPGMGCFQAKGSN